MGVFILEGLTSQIMKCLIRGVNNDANRKEPKMKNLTVLMDDRGYPQIVTPGSGLTDGEMIEAVAAILGEWLLDKPDANLEVLGNVVMQKAEGWRNNNIIAREINAVTNLLISEANKIDS